MKMFTVTQLKANAGKIIDQVIQGEAATVVRGNKLIILQPFELPAPAADAGFYSGSPQEKRHLSSRNAPPETARARDDIKAAIKLARARRK